MEKDELKAARALLGLSRPALAKQLGVSRVTLWRWEAGERPVPELAANLLQVLVKSAKRKRRSEKPP